MVVVRNKEDGEKQRGRAGSMPSQSVAQNSHRLRAASVALTWLDQNLHSAHLQESHRPVAFVLFRAEMKVRSLINGRRDDKTQQERPGRDPGTVSHIVGLGQRRTQVRTVMGCISILRRPMVAVGRVRCRRRVWVLVLVVGHGR